jgi:hypothetical protein
MLQQELLVLVVRVLEECGIEYMLTGSVVSSLQGEPRSSHDVDIVVSIQPSAVEKLTSMFLFPEFYLDRQMILDAIRSRSSFNLLHPSSGNKVDFWILRNTEFDASRFSRRQKEDVFGMSMWVTAPEDTILSKLDWAKQSGGSEKHLADARGVYEVQFYNLSTSYLSAWVEKLGVQDLWQRLISEAKIE